MYVALPIASGRGLVRVVGGYPHFSAFWSVFRTGSVVDFAVGASVAVFALGVLDSPRVASARPPQEPFATSGLFRVCRIDGGAWTLALVFLEC